MAVEAIQNIASYDQDTQQTFIEIKILVTPPDIPPETWTLPLAADAPPEHHHPKKKSKKK